MISRSSGVSYHNRYPYSTKIICEEHGTTFHRQVLQSAAGDKEVWQCKIYRSKGRKACSAPQIRSSELDQILAQIFAEMMKDKDAIIDSLITVLTHVPKEVDYERRLAHGEGEIAATKQKKLATATTILAVVFAVLVMAMHITHLASQDNYEYQNPSDVVDTVDSGDDAGTTEPADTTEGEDTTSDDAVKNPTGMPLSHASMPVAIAMCVLPHPTSP